MWHVVPQNLVSIAFCSLCKVICRYFHAYSCSTEELLNALFELIARVLGTLYPIPCLSSRIMYDVPSYLDVLFVVCSPLAFYFPSQKSNIRQEKKHLIEVGKDSQQKKKSTEVQAKELETQSFMHSGVL